MSLSFADRVQQTATNVGTSTVSLAGSVTGYQTFVGAGLGAKTVAYCIAHQTSDQWEVGIGVVTDSNPDTLSRDTVLSSSTGSLVNFSAGTVDVTNGVPAAKLVTLDETGKLALGVNVSGTNATAADVTVSAPVSTGTGTPASIHFQATHVGSSGSTAQTLEDMLVLSDRRATFPRGITVSDGTVTVSTPAITASQTWNAGGVAFTGWKLNVTDTASDSASLLLDLQVGGTSKVYVRKDGLVVAQNVNTVAFASTGGATLAAGATVQGANLTMSGVNILPATTGTCSVGSSSNVFADAHFSAMDGGAITGASCAVSGAITGASCVVASPTGAGIGYATGAGGSVTQATSRTTGVTINKLSGAITTNNASLAAGTVATFVVTNSTVAIGDVPLIAIRSGQNSYGTRVFVTAVAAGSFSITVANEGDPSSVPSEDGNIVINFAVIKAVSS